MNEIGPLFLGAFIHFIFLVVLILMIFIGNSIFIREKRTTLLTGGIPSLIKFSFKSRTPKNIRASVLIIIYNIFLFTVLGSMPFITKSGAGLAYWGQYLTNKSTGFIEIFWGLILLMVIRNTNIFISQREKANVDSSYKLIRSSIYLIPLIFILLAISKNFEIITLGGILQGQAGFNWTCIKMPTTFILTVFCALESLERNEYYGEKNTEPSLNSGIAFYGTSLFWSLLICILFFGGPDFFSLDTEVLGVFVTVIKTLLISGFLQFFSYSAFKSGNRKFFDKSWAIITLIALGNLVSYFY